MASIKDEYQTHVQTIQSELKTTVRTSQEQLAEQKSVHENAVGGLEQLLNESTQQQVELREQINAVTLRHSKELQDARERIIQLHTDLEESRQRADAESAERQSLIDQLTAANAELTVKQGTSVAELEEKTAALEKLRHDLEEMESIVAETTQRVLAAESGNMKSLDVLAEKEAVVEELEAKTAELQSEVDEVQAQASKAREQLQKREEDHRLVKNLLAASERKAAEYMEECRRLKKETEQSFDEKAKHGMWHLSGGIILSTIC